MQSLSSQAQTVWCSEWGKAFVSLRAIWFLFLCLEKQDFKKVMLILALFSWRKGRCVALRSNAHRQSKQTSDSLQLRLRRGLQSGVNGRHMLCLHAAFFSHSLLKRARVWMRQRRRVCFSGVYQVSLSVSTFAVKSESCQIQKWRVPDLTQDLCRQTRRLSCFLICCLFLLRETHKHTHLSHYTSGDLHWQHSLFKP